MKSKYDVIIIGSGIGGLSCAGYFAKNKNRVLILEKNRIPGGYATVFKRKNFVFDASLHSIAVGGNNQTYQILKDLGVLNRVRFVQHADFYRAIFPHHDIRVPQNNIQKYITTLSFHFSHESKGIQQLFDEMNQIYENTRQLPDERKKITKALLPALFRNRSKTFLEIMNQYIQTAELKAIIGQLLTYYLLPPSKLSGLLYSVATVDYLVNGAFYPVGKSKAISNALVEFIKENGGQIRLGSEVNKILVKDRTAYGVITKDGREFLGEVIVSNANAYHTFHHLIENKEGLEHYLDSVGRLSPSLSSFQIFLGLNEDITKKEGITDVEVFINPTYDLDEEYQASLNCDTEQSQIVVMIYNNLYEEYSPPNKSTVNILVLQGFDHWAQFEEDYWAGRKQSYNQEKERMAHIFIGRVQDRLIKNLRKYIETQEVATPLTNVRFTGNYKGAISGWDQTVDNQFNKRSKNFTPIRNLYLSGAWTEPGGGYAGALASGLQTFRRIISNLREM